MTRPIIRIATRTSDLALWQAHYVAGLLIELSEPPEVEIVHITTSGDRDQASALSAFGGSGAFTREVQHAVLDGRADIAVHSLKDLPTQSAPGLTLAAVPQRAATGDVIVLPSGRPQTESLSDLEPGLSLGTGSPRRQAQLRYLRPDLRVSGIRGNVPTRIRKLDAGEFDAIVLAAAGLDRLGLSHRISIRLGPPDFFGAVGQGALGIECRDDDDRVQVILGRLTCPTAMANVLAERSLLATLRAGCHAPVGVCTERRDSQLVLTAVLLNADGTVRIEKQGAGSPEAAVELGRSVAEEILEAGGDVILAGDQQG